MALNSTSGTVPRWGVLAITGVAITPAASGDQATLSFESWPSLVGVTPTGSLQPLIAIEPIAAGTMGRVAIAGITQVKLDIADTAHTRAGLKAGSTSELKTSTTGPFDVVWKEPTTGTGKWGYVRFCCSESSTLRVGKYMPTGTTGPWFPDTISDVAIYENGTPPSETTSNLTITGVVNHSVKVPYGAWVLIDTAANGYTYLVEAGLTGTTGCKTDIGGDDLTLIDGFDAAAVQLLGHTKIYPSGPSGPTGCVSLHWYTVTGCTG
jgi:hypothetical protein